MTCRSTDGGPNASRSFPVRVSALQRASTLSRPTPSRPRSSGTSNTSSRRPWTTTSFPAFWKRATLTLCRQCSASTPTSACAKSRSRATLGTPTFAYAPEPSPPRGMRGERGGGGVRTGQQCQRSPPAPSFSVDACACYHSERLRPARLSRHPWASPTGRRAMPATARTTSLPSSCGCTGRRTTRTPFASYVHRKRTRPRHRGHGILMRPGVSAGDGNGTRGHAN